jgi:GTPase SAR1 family protein
MASRKMILLGDPGVGKTSLVRRLVHGRFESDYITTLGVDITTYLVPIPPERRAANDGASELRLMIWDVQGDFGLKIFDHSYFKGTSAALIVGDIMRRPSQETMVALADGFEAALHGRPYALVLNKWDLVEGGIEAAGPALPEGLAGGRWQIGRTSAKSGAGVIAAFGRTADDLILRGV